MLELKPNCECCDIDLPPESREARICTFECTFCDDCADRNFDYLCPNCSGELVRRPIRPKALLGSNPPGVERFINKAHADYENYARHRKSGV